MKLCCIFNYAPDYRESIYKKIDQTFDTDFYFGADVMEGENIGIPKIDYSIFQRPPKEIVNKKLIGNSIYWRTGLQILPFKKFDTYLITGDVPYSYFPFLLFCNILGKNVYAWGHGFKCFNGRSGKFAKLFIKLLTGFFVYGEKGRQRMIDLGIPEKKLFTIYNSLEGRTELRDLTGDIYRNHFKNDYPNIIFIGRLTKIKQLDWLIRACADHKNQKLNYNIIFVGSGSEKNNLQDLSLELKIEDRVWFYGESHNEDIISPLIYNATLCVSPGNVGLTAINVLRLGTPVISHDNFELQMPEFETIIPGISGDLYKYGDYDDFKCKISSWLSRNMNRDEIRTNCLNVINDKWNSDYQIELLKNVLTTVRE